MPHGRILARGPHLALLTASPPTRPANSTLQRLRRPIHDPLTGGRPAVGQRRLLASVADEPKTSPVCSLRQETEFVPWFPSSNPSEEENEQLRNASPLDILLRVIQFRDVPRVLPVFLLWSQALYAAKEEVSKGNWESEEPRDLVELRKLPVETFSEILRWVDPIANPRIDLAHGINITKGQTIMTSSGGELSDQFGVRIHFRELLQAAQFIMDTRRSVGRKMVIQDYEICIRIAGAASDQQAAIGFWGATARDGLAQQRNTATWVEFTKALYLLDPLYYQYDRARVCIQARQMHDVKSSRYNRKSFLIMDRLRYSVSALKFEPWNRDRNHLANDLRMTTRHKEQSRRHWELGRHYGVLVNLELKCAAMISYARSSSYAHIRGNILNRGFGILLIENKESGGCTVSGGKYFRSGNPREPNEKFLDAIVETFGSMSRIRTALKLLVWASYRWDIPIPDKTWSNLLQFAYVCASKSFRRMREVRGPYLQDAMETRDVIDVWKVMTMEQFNAKPTFEDYSVYIRALLVRRNLREVERLIRDEMVPYYRRIEEEHRNIVEDEILRGVTQLSYQRQQIEFKKETVWCHISRWFHMLWKEGSVGVYERKGPYVRTVVPKFIAEFEEFLHPEVEYRVIQGRIALKRPSPYVRNTYRYERTWTLPERYSGPMVQSLERKGYIDRQDENFKWPEIRPMLVERLARQPVARKRATGRTPDSNDVSAQDWWQQLYQELRL